jgi:Planctomycete cytochrome C
VSGNLRVLLASLTALFAVVPAGRADQPTIASAAARVDYFEKNVRPILVNHCHTCHSAETKPAGGLRVDDRNGLRVGGNTGPAIVPGKPGESLLLKRVTQKNAKKRMPLEGAVAWAERWLSTLTTIK